MSYLVKTRYLSCSGVISSTSSFDNHDEALSFAFSCIKSKGYDEVFVFYGDCVVLNYRTPFRFE